MVTFDHFSKNQFMKTILILGAGLSASSMIRYLLNRAEENDWMLKIVDQDIEK